jgi:AraC-like DNA-binding protein
VAAVVIDTAEVAPQDRFEFWEAASAEVFEPLHVSRGREGSFSARLTRHRVGPLAVDHMLVDPSSARRTPELIRARDPVEIKLMLQLRGICAIAQDGRAAVVRPGELTSWHSSRPYTVSGQTRFEVLIVHCPSQLMGPCADRLRQSTARRVDGTTAIAVVVRQYLTTLVSGLVGEAFDPTCHGHLSEAALDLIRALLADADPRARAPKAAPRGTAVRLRAQILAYIEMHLAEAALTPDEIAHRHHISRSYLNRLFENQGNGVWRTIKAKRLERARADLADPALCEESVLGIASRWGFTSASHFSRSFRAQYGEAPTEFRRRMT